MSYSGPCPPALDQLWPAPSSESAGAGAGLSENASTTQRPSKRQRLDHDKHEQQAHRPPFADLLEAMCEEDELEGSDEEPRVESGEFLFVEWLIDELGELTPTGSHPDSQSISAQRLKRNQARWLTS